MESLNFEFLRPAYAALTDRGAFPEAYAYSDLLSAGVTLHAFADLLTGGIVVVPDDIASAINTNIFAARVDSEKTLPTSCTQLCDTPATSARNLVSRNAEQLWMV